MRIINQSYEITLLAPFTAQANLIEKCGRIAYASEDKIAEGSAEKFAKMIKSRNHGAVLEHSMMTVIFTTDRGISHELVRHRVASFTQESTRYCRFSDDKFENQVTFIRPSWVSEKILGSNEDRFKLPVDTLTTPEAIWLTTLQGTEDSYLFLLKEGWTPQQARAVLPNSLKTKIAVSANFREWLHIFKLRGIEKAAHPQMRDLILPLYEECRLTYPAIFDLGDPE